MDRRKNIDHYAAFKMILFFITISHSPEVCLVRHFDIFHKLNQFQTQFHQKLNQLDNDTT